MIMRKEENSIFLEPGDKLYRYDLGEKLDAEWLTDYSSPEYSFSEYGPKNKIGLFFFYNDISAAKNTLAQAVYNQKKMGTIYNYGTITSCQVIDDIRLLDLEAGLSSCSDKIRFLHQIGLNVITELFYNYQFKRPFSELQNSLEDLLSTDQSLSSAAENVINEFFYNFPPLLGQSLTDFDNGEAFKEMLENNEFEGYVFMEDFISDTYCLLSSDKITAPEHEIIDINSNEELQKFIASIELNEKLRKQ